VRRARRGGQHRHDPAHHRSAGHPDQQPTDPARSTRDRRATQTSATAMMAAMDRFEGRCWLDWWANSSLNLGDIEASVAITPTDTGWDAHGQLNNSTGDEERAAFAFLCDMDPVFTLRFQDGSTIDVTVTRTDDHRFTLTEYTGPTDSEVLRRDEP